MAKFSEIIGGIAKDLVQLQVSSDLASMEIFSHYKNNEIMKNLDIPRFKVSTISMKLKFAIAEETAVEQTDASVKYVETEWLGTLKGEVLKNSIASIPGLTVAEREMVQKEFIRSFSAGGSPDLDMKNALDGKSSTTVAKSVAYLMESYKKLPAESRKKLPAVNDLKKVMADTISSAFTERISALRKVAVAKAAVERDLEVIIEKTALESVSGEQMHEINFNLTPDFIKLVQEAAGS